MPTKKASKKTKKKSGGTKSSGKKAASRKTVGKKTSVKKAGTKKSAASAKGGKKATAKGASRKTGARKAARGSGKKAATTTRAATATKGIAGAQPLAAVAETLKGNCLGLATAGAIVESAVIAVGGISPGSYDVDKRLEQMGVITANQCMIVKQRILNDVRSFPCNIDDVDVTCSPGTVARAIRDQVRDNSSRP